MDQILNQLSTKSEADQLSSALDLMVDSLYNVKKNRMESVLKKSVPSEMNESFKKIFLDFGNDKEKIRSFLTQLKTALQNLKVLKLTLAIEPSKDSIEKINNWVQLNIGSGIILDLYEDSKIMGGAIIEMEGIYKDYSLRKRLDEMFEKKRAEIESFIK